MLKVFFLIIAYTTPSGDMHMIIKDHEPKCPTDFEALTMLEPLKEAGYIEEWQFWCREAYVVTPYNHPVMPGKKLQGKNT